MLSVGTNADVPQSRTDVLSANRLLNRNFQERSRSGAFYTGAGG
jgi:hypothetical protein